MSPSLLSLVARNPGASCFSLFPVFCRWFTHFWNWNWNWNWLWVWEIRIPSDNEHSNERGAHTHTHMWQHKREREWSTTKGKTCVPYIYERGKHFRQLIIHSHNVRAANKDAHAGEEATMPSVYLCVTFVIYLNGYKRMYAYIYSAAGCVQCVCRDSSSYLHATWLLQVFSASHFTFTQLFAVPSVILVLVHHPSGSGRKVPPFAKCRIPW